MLDGGICEVCDFYGGLLAQLGGHWRFRFHPIPHYGLKTLDQYIPDELANKAALTEEASQPWVEWKKEWARRMTKASTQKKPSHTQTLPVNGGSNVGQETPNHQSES